MGIGANKPADWALTGPDCGEATAPWDYVIIGAGSAGCVLAARLSEDPRCRVLLVEAGPRDNGLRFIIPKGFARAISDPKCAWHFAVDADAHGGRSEVWPRGKTLGGSSALNGMMYVRGHPADYNDWETNGAAGWNWAVMLKSFRAIEHHSLGESSSRGGSGPLRVTVRPPERLAICEAVIAAGRHMGLPERQDLNETAEEGIGYLPATIHRGRRWSASTAFLAPAQRRRNLHVMTDTLVERVVFDGRRAVGIAAKRKDGSTVNIHGAQVVLAAGAIQSPKLLQLSGVGPGPLLRSFGIEVVSENAGVGQNLLEHRLLGFQYRIRSGGYNKLLRGVGLALSVGQYALTRRGALSTGAYQVGAFIRTDQRLERPDSELLMGPYTVDTTAKSLSMEREPGMRIISFALRPRSQGSVMIQSRDPRQPPRIRANHLDHPYDQQVAVASARFIRHLAVQKPLSEAIVRELSPGADVMSDEEILSAYRSQGTAGMHASSTCRMGSDAGSVVDTLLRVRGVENLRVVDCSVFPSMISGNTNGPVMAVAWRAADIMLGLV